MMEMKSINASSDVPVVNFTSGPLNEGTSSDKHVLPHTLSNVLEEHEIVTASGIPLRVYHQPSSSKSVILTYHDIGTNHTSFFGFFSYPEMKVISRHFDIYHICAPGHHEGAEALVSSRTSESWGGFLTGIWNWSSSIAEESSPPSTVNQYPSMDELAEMLTSVVDFFKIQYFIGFGMGAGSNVLARYALHHPEHVFALFLINPNGTTHGYYEWFRNRWSDLPNLQRGILTDSLLSQLEAHWFGFGLAENQDLVAFYTQLVRSLNPVNVAGYIESYINRKDLGLVRCLDPPSVIEEREREAAASNSPKPVPTAIKVNCCLVTGSLAQDLARALSDLNGRMDPRKTQFMIIPDCSGFLMEEDPDKLAVNFLHFLRNEGFLVNMTPEKLHKEAANLQVEMAQQTAEALPSSAFMLEQEA
ncbi:hypothetical protein Aperf_G00000132274 [Anoplocephala perfoliata]